MEHAKLIEIEGRQILHYYLVKNKCYDKICSEKYYIPKWCPSGSKCPNSATCNYAHVNSLFLDKHENKNDKFLIDYHLYPKNNLVENIGYDRIKAGIYPSGRWCTQKKLCTDIYKCCFLHEKSDLQPEIKLQPEVPKKHSSLTPKFPLEDFVINGDKHLDKIDIDNMLNGNDKKESILETPKTNLLKIEGVYYNIVDILDTMGRTKLLFDNDLQIKICNEIHATEDELLCCNLIHLKKKDPPKIITEINIDFGGKVIKMNTKSLLKNKGLEYLQKHPEKVGKMCENHCIMNCLDLHPAIIEKKSSVPSSIEELDDRKTKKARII